MLPSLISMVIQLTIDVINALATALPTIIPQLITAILDGILKLLDNVKGNKVFIAPDVAIWKCRNCGHIHVAKCAPKVCPTCDHAQSYFDLRAANY